MPCTPPALNERLDRIASSIGGPDYAAVLAEEWSHIDRISVDYALLENIDSDLCVIPVDIGWTDIGNFGALHAVLADEAGDNVTIGPPPLVENSSGVLIHSDRIVAAVGLENIVIVDTGDVLLVCHRDHVQDVKKIVASLEEREQDNLL